MAEGDRTRSSSTERATGDTGKDVGPADPPLLKAERLAAELD
jgi:hypothetical protein